ncbi:MAG: hypothetical protein U0905_13420 [Pirellulales bacterium]
MSNKKRAISGSDPTAEDSRTTVRSNVETLSMPKHAKTPLENGLQWFSAIEKT